MNMWTLLHKIGDKPCGEPAFKACRKPLVTDLISPKICRNLDGSIPLPTDPIVCQSCGGSIWGIHADDFVEDES